MRVSPPLTVASLACVALAVACAIALALDDRVLDGVPPAVKPLKFAGSVGLLLASLALIMPRLGVGAATRDGLTWLLIATLVLELIAIALQAVRGRPSHFNITTPLDHAIWATMGIAIVIATIGLAAIAVIAVVRPLGCSPLVALAVRLGLALVLLVAVSGFAMAGRNQHSVGGLDGGDGLPVTGWSTQHGDLRVSHFFALHGLQALPIAALVLDQVPIGSRSRTVVLSAIAAVWIAICVVTLAQALAGRPVRG